MRNMPKTSVGDVRVDEAAVEAKRTKIRDAMRGLGDRIASGDDSELLYWVIDDALACAHRPSRYHPRYAASFPLCITATWPAMSGLDLQADDLIGYFCSQGFAVAHHP